MKPRLVRTPGVPGISSPQWWSTGGGAVGHGATPKEAYSAWVQCQFNTVRQREAWIQATNAPSVFEQWANSYAAWWK